ncbi:hypothetical protein EIY72_27010 [Pseudomonas vancouverensis]|uniref:Uncharacterized protein n=1 Tax=Pseudomonas vancouverensis TaxID=95300 RepID=A0A4R4JSN2_PSEVA|nr:hypothetical protein F7R09_16875 [Pseudomonas vancouverensis]TDB56986.1 hypothetical protein EIY72_27010 [Pseudomonas vancouverensis]
MRRDKNNCGEWFQLWRGSLLPLGCEAAPFFCDCCAIEREQAPSPQGQSWPQDLTETTEFR